MNINEQLGATVLCDPRMHVLEVLETEHGHQGDDPSLRSRLGRRLGFGDNAVEVKQSLYDATRKYVWDADIHLMSVTTEGHREAQRNEMGSESKDSTKLTPHNAVDEAPSKTTTTRFVYDALHRRVGRVKDDGEVTVFVYEGWNVIAEKTVRRALTGGGEKVELGTRYVWGEDLSGTLQGAGGIGGLLSSVQDGGPTEKGPQKVTSFFHYDSNGNVILLTDLMGRETGRYAYDAFGKTLTATGPAARGNRYRFSTKPVEEESGLVYYGYRYYDPVTGRWPSRDPIGELGGVNVYGMVGNQTTVECDVLGFGVIHWIAKMLVSEMVVMLTGILQNHCHEIVGDPTSKATCITCCRVTSAIAAGGVFVTWAVGVVESFIAGIATAGAGGVINMMAVTGITIAQVAQLVDTHQSCIDSCNECPIP